MAIRKYRLENALERVLGAMNLRRPQRESLEKLHRLFLDLGRDPQELDREEVVGRVREIYPSWSFAGGFPEATFALATGVGKTRLMGAIIAYLYLSNQSRNFLILAPRAAVLRKLEAEAQPGHAKYLFVEKGFVPDPVVWRKANLESFKPEPDRELFERGPMLAIFSPQSLTGDDRRAARVSEFSGASLIEHLKCLNDLVILVDEAHHLGRVAEKETRAWTQAVRDLRPRFQFGMTATPRQEANVLHQYDLRTCLKEKLYTKDVRLIVRQRGDAEGVTDVEWDHHTMDFALDRLRAKERELAEYSGTKPFPAVQPVLLVCAANTGHAEEVAQWLRDRRGIREHEMLVTHSEKTKSEQDIERLVLIEHPENRVRIVVNVFELTEGWDVTNVYVIAPLRSMGTFQGAIQTMGRGLRLPAGMRVGNEELDRLDVLCFGRESLQDILKCAMEEYGDTEDEETFVGVRNADDDDGVQPPEATKLVDIRARRAHVVTLKRAEQRPAEPDLDFEVAAIRRIAQRNAVEFDITKGAVGNTVEGVRYEFEVFIRVAAARVIAGLRYLSELAHRDQVERLVRVLLEALEYRSGQTVSLDWIQVSEVIKEQIDTPYRKREIVYQPRDATDELRFGDFKWRVPEDSAASVGKPKHGWVPGLRRIPISGWKNCVHEAVPFDSSAEFKVAQILDLSASASWWVRNDPARLRIPTPIGMYEPDFCVGVRTKGKSRIIVLEIKRGDLWMPQDSDPRVKARAAEAWCEAVNHGVSDATWEHWIVLDHDLENAQTIDDLEKVRIGRWDETK